jgi:hypothetical protein
MAQSPSWEAYCRAVSQEHRQAPVNPKFRCRVYKNSSTNPFIHDFLKTNFLILSCNPVCGPQTDVFI